MGVLFGIPSLRIKGLYLAVATLAAQFFVDWACLRLKWVTNDSSSGSVSVAGLNVLGLPIETPVQKYLFCLAFLVVFALLAKNLVRGHIGREWMAIRDMDVAAAVIGIRPVYAKLTAFAVSSFIVGVAGALWGFVYLGSWEPAAFNIDRSFQLLFMVIIGGLGSIMGSFFGAAFIVALPIVLDNLPVWFGIPIDTALAAHLAFMIFGALIVFFLIVEPHGIARLWSTGQGEAAAVAVPALSIPFQSTSRRRPVQPSPFPHPHGDTDEIQIDRSGNGRGHDRPRRTPDHFPGPSPGQGAVLPAAGLPHRRLRAQRHALGQRQAGLHQDDQCPRRRHQRREAHLRGVRDRLRHRQGRRVLRAPEGQDQHACSTRSPPASPSR